MEEIRGDKIERVLQLYAKLADGYVIHKEEEAQRFGVNKRSIQSCLLYTSKSRQIRI